MAVDQSKGSSASFMVKDAGEYQVTRPNGEPRAKSLAWHPFGRKCPNDVPVIFDRSSIRLTASNPSKQRQPLCAGNTVSITE